MYKIAFFDVDGTLLNSDHKVSQRTKEAIQLLQGQGIMTVIATGRVPFQVHHVGQEVGIDSFITMNGAVVTHRGQLVYKNPLDREAIRASVEISQQNGHILFFCTLNQFYSSVHPEDPVTRAHPSHPYLEDGFPDYHPECYLETDIYQMQLFCPRSDEHHYQRVSDKIKLYHWNVHFEGNDIVNMNTSKAAGIMSILEYLNVDASEAIAFGDGDNDIEMIEQVGLGIAMGNGREHLKRVADFVTKSNNEDGIYYALKELGVI